MNNFLKISLFVMAGLVLTIGLFTGISLLLSATNVHSMLFPLTILGGEVLSNLIAPFLTGLLSWLGGGVLVISLVLSLLLYATGRLVGRVSILDARVAQLEAKRNTRAN
jgi:hypothetical protein